MARTLIKNGTVVSPTGRHRVDVLIEGDTISAMLEPGKGSLSNSIDNLNGFTKNLTKNIQNPVFICQSFKTLTLVLLFCWNLKKIDCEFGHLGVQI